MRDRPKLGVVLDKDSEKDRNDAAGAPQDAATEALQDPSRRRFSRGALAGGAVLLSLGNRSAWGNAPGFPIGCMSLTTLNSFNPQTGMFVSAPSGAIRPDHNENLAAELHRIGDAPLFTGTDGEYSVCEDPNSLDSVCLVKGICPSVTPINCTTTHCPARPAVAALSRI